MYTCLQHICAEFLLIHSSHMYALCVFYSGCPDTFETSYWTSGSVRVGVHEHSNGTLLGAITSPKPFGEGLIMVPYCSHSYAAIRAIPS